MSSRNLLISLVICTWALVLAKQQFPRSEFRKSWTNTATGDKMVTKKEYNQKERCGANGTGKDRLRVLYQNGGNLIHTFGIISQIETMLNNVRPHVFYMSENMMDEKTKERLQNRHGFTVETMGEKERIWAAVRTTVPYVRRRDCEVKGICALWLEFGTGQQKQVFS